MMRDYVRKVLAASRPISWVNTAYPFAAGYIVTSGGFGWRAVLGTFYFLVPYNILMYGINDVFDYESDRRNPRKGGVEGTVLDTRFHRIVLWTAVLSNLPFLAILLATGTLPAGLTLLAVVCMVVAYSVPGLRFKERALLDSVTSSCHFAGPLVYALALAGFPAAAWPVVGAFFVWGMASHAFGAVQDVLADRAAHIGSIATVIGARATVRLAAALYAASGLLLVIGVPAAWPAAACALIYIANIVPFWRITDATATTANRGWRRFIWLNWLTGAVVTNMLLFVFRGGR